MSTTAPITIHMSDIESVAAKLDSLHRQLTPNEQVVLDWLLERAAASAPHQDDVQGYISTVLGTNGSPVRTTLGGALGLTGGFAPASSPTRSGEQRGIIVIGG